MGDFFRPSIFIPLFSSWFLENLSLLIWDVVFFSKNHTFHSHAPFSFMVCTRKTFQILIQFRTLPFLAFWRENLLPTYPRNSFSCIIHHSIVINFQSISFRVDESLSCWNKAHPFLIHVAFRFKSIPIFHINN